MVNIIWTCIATIFAGIWVAIHLNVSLVRRRARLMMLALVASNYYGVRHLLCLYVPRYLYGFYY